MPALLVVWCALLTLLACTPPAPRAEDGAGDAADSGPVRAPRDAATAPVTPADARAADGAPPADASAPRAADARAPVTAADAAPVATGPEVTLPKTTTAKLPVPPGFPDAISDLPAHAEFGGTIHRDGPGNFWIWVPPSVREIRGILWHTELFRQRNMKPVLAQHGFALLKVHGPIKKQINAVTGTAEAYKAALLGALRDLGKASGHPELEHAPIFASCFAQDSPWCRSLARYLPERTLGYMAASFNVPWGLAKLPKEVGETPGLFVGNSEEIYTQPTLDALVGPFTAGLAISWGSGHFSHPVLDMLFAYVDQIIKLRLPADASPKQGPVVLTPLPRADGWLLDHRASLAGAQATIAPVAAYPKEKEQASWLPNRYLAFVMQGFNNKTPDVRLTAPTTAVTGGTFKPTAAGDGLGVLKAGQAVILRATAGAGVTEVAFYDGDRLLGRGVREGTSFSLGPVRFDEPGARALLAEGTAAGKKTMSRPALLFVVRP